MGKGAEGLYGEGSNRLGAFPIPDGQIMGALSAGMTSWSDVAERRRPRAAAVSRGEQPPRRRAAHEPNHPMDQNHPEPLVAQPDSLPRQAYDTAYLVPADLVQSPCEHKAGKLVDTKGAASAFDRCY
jgi:hypothetical protein